MTAMTMEEVAIFFAQWVKHDARIFRHVTVDDFCIRRNPPKLPLFRLAK